MGFKGGKVLEPALGIGNFFGAMPERLRSRSSLNGVELDPLTARIAKQLYQKANIEETGYQNTKFPNNYFDVVISNVPFGDYKVNDPNYDRYKLSIHNYFLVKSIDQVRPGGIVMIITSTGTLDSTRMKDMREVLSGKADFIGAVRLPNTTFEKNAGTSVTTDLIVLRKKDPRHPYSGEAQKWIDNVDSGVVEEFKNAPWNNQNLPINEYFHDHPDMILGELIPNKMYGNRSSGVAVDGEGVDIERALAECVEQFLGL